ncbi:unnamed protein product [Rotaria socialis]|uniref:Uncharacterized protein n=1 Tax=Rotaria socialis TaxID=392032 RepID=A0A817RRL5_9BILA|nr:unnamed protein product [Rotaria socialis]
MNERKLLVDTDTKHTMSSGLQHSEGFEVERIQQSFNIKVYGCIGDSPALKLMSNMIGHNGYYPCYYCDIKGVHIRKPRKRQYPYTPANNCRTVNSFYVLSREAQLKSQNIFGHLGISILEDVLDVPLPHGIIIDYAHVSLLRHFRDVIRVVASSLAPAMRGVQDFSFIKAIELKNLLLYGFIPHFMNYLTTDQLCFISLFTIGIRLLHADSVFNHTTSVTANNLFRQYYADHHKYFSHLANFVLHLHQHFQVLYDCHGPLSSINTFAQEDFIGYISKNKNGATSFDTILAYYYNIDVLLKNLDDKTMHNDNGNICFLILLKNNLGPLDLFLIERKHELFNELNNYHKQNCLCSDFYECIKTYRRFVLFNKIFHSLQYIKRKTTNSYFVQYLYRSEQPEFGIIKVFFQHRRYTYALIQNFQVVNAFSEYFKESQYYALLKQSIDKIYFVLKRTNNSRIVLADKIQRHLIIFENCKGK